MASRGPGDGYAGGCRRVQGPSESLSVGTCAVLAPCLREARSCLVAAWCRGGCCPRGPAPGDLVLLLLATRAPYSLAVLLAAHHPTGECGPSPSWAPRWVGAREAEFSNRITWLLTLENGPRLRPLPNPCSLRLRPLPNPYSPRLRPHPSPHSPRLRPLPSPYSPRLRPTSRPRLPRNPRRRTNHPIPECWSSPVIRPSCRHSRPSRGRTGATASARS